MSLGGATLQTPFTGTMPENASFTVLHENGSSSAVGSFAGIVEGGTVTLGTTQFILTYVGGSGNDVVKQSARPTKVTADPTDLTVNLGNGATFTAAASGVPIPDVQWQESVDGGELADMAGRPPQRSAG